MTRPAETALLIGNLAAGSTSAARISDVAGVLQQRYDVQAVMSAGPDDLRAALDAFGGRHVIVAGGDGSLHLLLNLLAASRRLDRVAVGLVPLGTANDFASGTGVPGDPVAAAQVCVRGTPTPMDLLVADDGEVVVNAAHAGLGAVASARAQAVKPLVGRLAYPLAALAAGASRHAYRIEITVDDAVVHDGPSLFVLAANGPRLGGGPPLCAAADAADGLVDVMLIGDVPVADRAVLAMRIQRGDHGDDAAVSRWTGTRLRIRGDAIDHSRDGEVRHGLTDVTYTMHAGAWTMLR